MASAARIGDPDLGNPFAALNEEWARLHPPRPAAEPLPWHRNTRLLAGLIAVASAALAVSTALLLAGAADGGQGRERSTPDAEPAPASTPPTEPAAPAPAAPSVPSQPAEAPAARTAPDPVWVPPAPDAPAVPATPEDAVPASAEEPQPPKRPRTNVTRTPMSFAPGETP
jgi:hypothetical protein